jgi:hypothetical protein
MGAIQVNGQTSIQPVDATINFDEAQRPCIQVKLDPEPKTLKEAWKDYLKDNYDFKLKGIGFLRNKDLLSAEEINVAKISSKQIDFYTHISEDENGSEMKVFVRFGYDIYLNKEDYPNEYETLTVILKDFLNEYLTKYYQEKVNDTEERIEELEDETTDLKEEIADDTASIKKLKKEIEDLESQVESNNKLLEEANNKLIKRKEKLERVRIQLENL